MQAQNYVLMAQYNQWINNRLLACAATLSEDQLTQDMGAFFRSVLGTLNHLYVADIIWLKRFARHPADFTSLEYLDHIENPAALDSQPFDRLDELRAKRQELDEVILQFTEELDQTSLNTRFAYRNMKGDEFNDKLTYPLQHFFNHQTHHRGQLSTLLNQLDVDVGVTDLLMTIRDMKPD